MRVLIKVPVEYGTPNPSHYVFVRKSVDGDAYEEIRTVREGEEREFHVHPGAKLTVTNAQATVPNNPSRK
jgi:hypothetical protein